MPGEKINTRIKLAALWTSVTLCYLYGDYFELYVPGKVTGLVSGNNLLDSPAKLFSASVLLAIPALMVSVAVLVKKTTAKKLNIIFGILYTAIMLLIAVTSLSPWRSFYVMLAIVEAFLTFLVIRYAFKWPVQSTMEQ